MSWVTNFVVLTQIDEEDAIAVVNGHPIVAGAFAPVHEHSGGRKAFEADVYLAAFNNCVIEEIRTALSLAPWRNPDSVRVLLMDQEDERWSDLPLLAVATTADI